MFLLNSRYPLVCATGQCLRTAGLPSSEVTGAFCRVPSPSFSQAPWYSLPVHLCRFRVRFIRVSYFLELPGCRYQSNQDRQLSTFVTSPELRNINRIPIDYSFRSRLRGRLTLRGLTLRRNPWTFGDSVSRTVCRYSCQHSHFRYLQEGSPALPSQTYGTLRYRLDKSKPTASVRGLSPGTFSAQDCLFRPVSYYAFFKGWLLLSQPPGCLGFPTSFPT